MKLDLLNFNKVKYIVTVIILDNKSENIYSIKNRVYLIK